MATTITRLTIDDYEMLPANLARGHDLVDGELVEVPGNAPRHNIVRDCRVGLKLGAHVESHGLGMVLWEQQFEFLNNARAPDLAFFGPEKRAFLDLDKRVQRFVPDLAIEVISPSNGFDEVMRKRDLYLRAGTPEVWLLSPVAHEVFVYRGTKGNILGPGETLTSDLLPGFSLDIDELFEGLD